ncbi:hypothetical protein K1719_039357 [Acacia pycnantha]|nr:hypothetical protein K1719_039357 [Acacia pycnantha]
MNGQKFQANVEVDSEELVDAPKVEDKIGAVPNGLSTDSDVAKREAESISKRSLRSNREKFEFQAEVSRLMDIIINSSTRKRHLPRELMLRCTGQDQVPFPHRQIDSGHWR